MSFYATYNGVLEGAKTILRQNVSGLENVAVGGNFKVERLPMVVIDPAVTPIKKEALGRHLGMALRFTLVYIVSNTERARL